MFGERSERNVRSLRLGSCTQEWFTIVWPVWGAPCEGKPAFHRGAACTGVEKTGPIWGPQGNFCFFGCNESHLGRPLCLNVLKRSHEMTQKERRQLIELGILTEDCGPSITYWKLSPQLKREARRRMNERERMTSGLLLTRILERLKRT